MGSGEVTGGDLPFAACAYEKVGAGVESFTEPPLEVAIVDVRGKAEEFNISTEP